MFNTVVLILLCKQNAKFDKKTLQRIQELDLLEPEKKKTLFDLIDTYIRDAKTRQAYAS